MNKKNLHLKNSLFKLLTVKEEEEEEEKAKTLKLH